MKKKIMMIAGLVVLLGGAATGGLMLGKHQSPSAKPVESASVEEELATDAGGEAGKEGASAESKGEAKGEGHGETKGGKEGEAKGGGTSRADLSYEFEKFTTNLSDDLNSFVQLKVEVETASAAAKKQVTENVAPLRDATLMLLSSKTKEDLQSQAGKERLKRELLVRYQGVFNSSKVVRNLYISDFMVVRP